MVVLVHILPSILTREQTSLIINMIKNFTTNENDILIDFLILYIKEIVANFNIELIIDDFLELKIPQVLFCTCHNI